MNIFTRFHEWLFAKVFKDNSANDNYSKYYAPENIEQRVKNSKQGYPSSTHGCRHINTRYSLEAYQTRCIDCGAVSDSNHQDWEHEKVPEFDCTLEYALHSVVRVADQKYISISGIGHLDSIYGPETNINKYPLNHSEYWKALEEDT